MKTTRLSEKLRRLGRRKPELQLMCIRYAAQLDMAAASHGTDMSKDSATYRMARMYYARAIGRAYDFGADADLEMVDRDDV